MWLALRMARSDSDSESGAEFDSDRAIRMSCASYHGEPIAAAQTRTPEPAEPPQ